jgi:hypothetical protein
VGGDPAGRFLCKLSGKN